MSVKHLRQQNQQSKDRTQRFSIESNLPSINKDNDLTKINISSKRNHQKINKVNYYDMFSKALKQNNDIIANYDECVDEINMLSGYKKHISNSPKSKAIIFFQDQQAEKAQFLELAAQKAKNEQIVGPINPIINFDQENSSGDDMTKRTKSPKGKKTKRRNTDNSINDYDEKDEAMMKFAINAKRRRVLNSALIYLESNSIFLPEFLQKNPFQSKPFAMPYSTEFMTSIKFNEFDAIRIALKANIELLFTFDYFLQTAFHWAAKLGNKKMLTILLSYGRACNQYDHRRCTPLYLAALNNQYDCCELLLNNYGNPFLADINGKRPIDVASDPAIQILLTKNMDQPYSNPIIKNKITLLIKSNNDRQMKKLMDAKAAKENEKIKSKLHKESTSFYND